MQKHNETVDKIKNKWAHGHQVPLLRIWEHDINNDPSGVIRMLKREIGVATKKQEKKDEMGKRH